MQLIGKYFFEKRKETYLKIWLFFFLIYLFWLRKPSVRRRKSLDQILLCLCTGWPSPLVPQHQCFPHGLCPVPRMMQSRWCRSWWQPGSLDSVEALCPTGHCIVPPSTSGCHGDHLLKKDIRKWVLEWDADLLELLFKLPQRRPRDCG